MNACHFNRHGRETVSAVKTMTRPDGVTHTMKVDEHVSFK